MTENSMENSRIIELIVKKVGKIASVEELTELESLLAVNPSYSYLAEVVDSLKGSKEHFEKNIPGPELAETGWSHLSGLLQAGEGEAIVGVESATPREEFATLGEVPADPEIKGYPRLWRKLSPVWQVAAAAVVMTGMLGVWYYGGKAGRSTPAYADRSIDVRYGRRSELLLSDGTKVWLNAGSRLKYPEAFSGSSREVELEGEAYFDVAQQANNPFLVHAGKITVKVLGTRFDVKAYREDTELSTTLISGKVQVMLNDDPEKKIILSSHEKLTVVNGKTSPAAPASPSAVIHGITHNALSYQVQLLPVVGHDSLSETAWIDNKLVVSNQAFGEVARLLERKYDVQIAFGDEGLRQQHLSGVFEKETIEQVFDILRMTTRFTYTIKGKQIMLAKNR